MANAPKKRERMCVGCGTRAEKRALYRVVRSSDGVVSLDVTGRAPGRGAYICSVECLEKATKRGALGRALRCAVEGDRMAVIASELAGAINDAPTR